MTGMTLQGPVVVVYCPYLSRTSRATISNMRTINAANIVFSIQCHAREIYEEKNSD